MSLHSFVDSLRRKKKTDGTNASGFAVVMLTDTITAHTWAVIISLCNSLI